MIGSNRRRLSYDVSKDPGLSKHSATTPSAVDSTQELALLSQQVTQRIKSLILAGDLAPGSRIRQEELALRFGTSRIPVREALRTLENEGLVTLKPNSGASVAKVDLHECVEIYKIRERIEPLALAESVPNLNDAQLKGLEELVERMELAREMEEFLRSYDGAAMCELTGLITRYWNKTQQYRRAFTRLVGPGGRWIINYEHRLIMESVKRRDVEESASLLHGHIRRTRLELGKHPEVFQS
jgi:DNA-binding GntR family transcriptional regulator